MAHLALHGILFSVTLSQCLATFNPAVVAFNKVVVPGINAVTEQIGFVELAKEQGFEAETHYVTTDDGYILTLHRILAAAHCEKKYPILCMHALLQSSEAFLDSGPDAPGFVLARECRDVWFGNVRGNYLSKKHVSLNPDTDLAFWKFSFDHMGKYDVPAIVDYILGHTSSDKLTYVGFSQGGGIFIVMLNERPEYADKVSLFVGLGPCTRQLNTKSPVFRIFSEGVLKFQSALEASGIWQLLYKDNAIQGSLSSLCKIPLLAPFVCGIATQSVDSSHPDSVTPEIQQRLYRHAPVGTSTQNMAHYGQGMNNKKFYKFDYGADQNLKVYGSSSPPAYSFDVVKVPTVIYHGPADHIADTEDVEWAVNQMPYILEYVQIEDPQWNHYDLVYSRYWKDTIFSSLKGYLSKYSEYSD